MVAARPPAPTSRTDPTAERTLAAASIAGAAGNGEMNDSDSARTGLYYVTFGRPHDYLRYSAASL